MKSIIEQAKYSHSLGKNDIIHLLKNSESDELIFNTANQLRKESVGDEVHLRALIEFSNICKRNCFYCGLRCDNKKAERYRLSPEQIIETANLAIKKGYKTVVLQSGEDAYYTAPILADIIKEIKKSDIAVTLSIGEMSYEDYATLKVAGADRFLLRIETTDKELYKKLHPNMSYENRVRCLYDLKKLGYETGTGCLVGLPEQTLDSLADDIQFFKKLDADMVGIGPFIPHPDTPLDKVSAGSFHLALKVMAITRILLPDANIPATTAMETLHKNGRNIALNSGANVVMPNFTKLDYRKKYEIYPNKNSVDYSEIVKELNGLGRTVSNQKGNRKGKQDEYSK